MIDFIIPIDFIDTLCNNHFMSVSGALKAWKWVSKGNLLGAR
jgi:hypothetical protein